MNRKLILIIEIISLIESKEKQNKWTEEDYNISINGCINDLKEQYYIDTIAGKEYCECSTQRISENFNRNEYIDIFQFSLEKQKELIMPIIQNCLEEYQKKLKLKMLKKN